MRENGTSCDHRDDRRKPQQRKTARKDVINRLGLGRVTDALKGKKDRDVW